MSFCWQCLWRTMLRFESGHLLSALVCVEMTLMWLHLSKWWEKSRRPMHSLRMTVHSKLLTFPTIQAHYRHRGRIPLRELLDRVQASFLEYSLFVRCRTDGFLSCMYVRTRVFLLFYTDCSSWRWTFIIILRSSDCCRSNVIDVDKAPMIAKTISNVQKFCLSTQATVSQLWDARNMKEIRAIFIRIG